MAEKQPSVAEQIAAAPPPPAASTNRALGVPEGYAPARPQPGFTPFTEIDVLAPQALDPNKVFELQKRMAAAGLFGKQKYPAGLWDALSQNAYRQVLETANVYGVNQMQALELYTRTANNQPQQQPLARRRLNPDELRSTFTTAVRTEVGRVDDPQLIEQMVSAYQQADLDQQARVAEAEEMGGTVTEMADPRTFAEQRIRDADPNAAAAHDAVGLYQTFLDLWTGQGGEQVA